MRNTKSTFIAVILLSAIVSVVVNAAIELTPASYKTTLGSGKNGMIKYYQSWCGHCTRMKPDWDRLAEEAHDSVFIADVNCGDQKELCDEVGVTGYPTIKYHLDGKEFDYTRGRGYDELSAFVSDTLALQCDISKLDECSERSQQYANKWLTKGDIFNIAKEVNRLNGMMDKSMAPELKRWIKERIVILNQGLKKDDL